MGVNQVVVNGETIIDTTATTVAADNLLQGYTAVGANGEVVVGTLKVSNKNLLINPDFRINQRGQTSYNSAGYTVDRWKWNSYATLVVNDGYISLSTENPVLTFLQHFYETPLLLNETYTMSCVELNGTVTVAVLYPGVEYIQVPISTGAVLTLNRVFASVAVALSTGTTNIVKCKVEKGSVSTILSDPPVDIAVELLRCQRYYQASIHEFTMSNNIWNVNLLQELVRFCPHMRVVPTVTVKSMAGTPNVLSFWENNADTDINDFVPYTPGITQDYCGSFYSASGKFINNSAKYKFRFYADAEIY